MLVPFEKYGAVKTAAHAELYGRIFEELPSGSSVLEIGIGRGNSMKAFVEARPDLQFCAVDNFAEGQYDHELPEAVLFLEGSQSNEKTLWELSGLGPFSLIIDDASHYGKDQQPCFKYLFPYVEPNGFYVIEDLHAASSRAEGCSVDTLSFLESLGEIVAFFPSHDFPKDIAVIRKQ
jgi:hypothetical protein